MAGIKLGYCAMAYDGAYGNKRYTGEMQMSNLLYNAIRTPDGTVIESRHRHDFVCHEDANGKRYCIDGGMAYSRRVGPRDYEDISVYDDDDHEVIREVFKWGTYGLDGGTHLTMLLLKDMGESHLLNIMDDGTHPHLTQLFHNELEYRRDMIIRESIQSAVGQFIVEKCE